MQLQRQKKLQPLDQQEQTVIQHQPRIHGRLVVNIFHLVIVHLHDNRIDGQLPNDLKTHRLSSLLSPSSSSCVCKRYQTVRVSMSICSTVEFRFVSLRACFVFFFFQVSRSSLSLLLLCSLFGISL